MINQSKLKLVTFVVTVVISIYAIYLLDQYSYQQKHLSIQKIASSYASHIRNDLNQALSAAYPIGALIRTQKGDVSGFTELATEMLSLYPAIASLQLLPDGILQYIVPMKGNESAIGHNLLLDPKRNKEAFLARDSGKLTLAGPFNLIQSGIGAVARLPIYLDTREGKQFWGFAAALIRFPNVLTTTDLPSLSDSGIGYQLSRIHPDTGEVHVISTSNTLLIDETEIFDIPIPNGHWTFQAYPIDGWRDYPTLLFGAFLGLLFVSLATFSSALWIRLRLNYLRLEQTVTKRTKELQGNVERLAESERRLNLSQKVGGIGTWEWNIKTDVVCWSDQVAELFGYLQAQSDTTYDDFLTSIHPDDKDNVVTVIKNCIESDTEYNIDYRVVWPDGSVHWLNEKANVVRDDTGKAITVLAVAIDITERKIIEERMVVTSQLLNESEQVGHLGGWKLDLKTGDLFWTDETYRIHETSPEEFNPTVDAGVGFYLPESKKIISNALEEATNHGIGFDLELETHTTKGKKIDVRATCLVTQEAGVPIRLTGIFQDISVQKANQRKLEKSNLDLANANAGLKLAACVFGHAGEGIIITDATATIIDVNDTFTAITGYSHEEAIGQNPRFLHSGRQIPNFYDDMWQVLMEKGVWSGEIWNRKKSGEVYAEMLNISSVKDDSGQISNYVGLFTDITLIKEHQGKLEHIAHYDLLTNLPNRVLLADRLSQAMLQCSRHAQSLAVVFLDLDGFKHVNDAHGHDVGDELLIALSLRMKEALRGGDSIARIGGDEFVAVLTDLTTVEDCEPVLERLLLSASDPVTVGDVVFNISASIGVTLYPQDNVEADQLMRHADQAMYVAKESGKNRYHLFDTTQDDAVKVQRECLHAIRSALDNNQFVLYYQPKVNMKTGTVTGAEALIRWQHPERGLLNPIEFLPVIENNPMSIEMGEWVIDAALTQISQWQKMGLNPPLSVSVNIAAVQIQQPGFTDRLMRLLAAHPDVEPSYLELEVLETSALDDVNHVSTIMNACMTLGVNFALDDFGTGYSSLTYLRRLPANLIKIDQSFVRDMLSDSDDLAIVEGIIALAKSFKRDVIAEGVETIEHGTALLQLGCELAQGYGIARPMPASDIPAWISDWKPDVSWNT